MQPGAGGDLLGWPSTTFLVHINQGAVPRAGGRQDSLVESGVLLASGLRQHTTLPFSKAPSPSLSLCLLPQVEEVTSGKYSFACFLEARREGCGEP